MGRTLAEHVTTRLWVLLARKSPTAVVFRRGPAKQVLVLRWNTAGDTFEEGQWLKGRIFERRCDLSPSGELLVYFAAKHKGTYPTYTAVSRPPWLTALALWEGLGTWGGGGLFANERTLELNHGGTPTTNEGGLPPQLRVVPFGTHPGRGEDDPISHMRMLRDGWMLAEPGTFHPPPRLDPQETEIAGKKTKVAWRYDPPRVYRRVQPAKPSASLDMRVHGLHEQGGPWYALVHAVLDGEGRERASLGRSDWADWDARGDLLFARDGRLYRVAREHVFDPEGRARELVDLRALSFTRRIAPPWARRWETQRPK